MANRLTYVVWALVAGTTAAPALSQSKDADQSYCMTLVQTYQQTRGQTQMRNQGFLPISLEITKAIDGCKSGDAVRAIPTLEKRLRELEVALPPR